MDSIGNVKWGLSGFLSVPAMAAAVIWQVNWEGVTDMLYFWGDSLAVTGLASSTKLKPGVILNEMTVDCVRASKCS